MRRAIAGPTAAVYLGAIGVLLLLALVAADPAGPGAAGSSPGFSLLLAVLLVPAGQRDRGQPGQPRPRSDPPSAGAAQAPVRSGHPRVVPHVGGRPDLADRCRTAVRKLVDDLEIRYLANQDPNLHLRAADRLSRRRAGRAADGCCAAGAGSARRLRRSNRRHADGRGGQLLPAPSPAPLEPPPGRLDGLGAQARQAGRAQPPAARRRAGPASLRLVGDDAALRDVRYVITLDTDTQLPRDAARRLVGTIAHPLNRAVFDPEPRAGGGRGTGSSSPASAPRWSAPGVRSSRRIFTGNTGLDPYTTAVSDIYQDLFGEGSYYGKGHLRRRRVHGRAGRTGSRRIAC